MSDFPMRFLPDAPIITAEADALGFSGFVDLVEQAVRGTADPFVHGVLGDWGVGKTSILHLLRSRFGSTDAFVPIWFNAWQYENEHNLIYPLLHAIRRQFITDVGEPSEGRLGKSLRDAALASALLLGDLGLRGSTRLFTGEALRLADIKQQLADIRDHSADLTDVLDTWVDSVGQLQAAFTALLAEYAAGVAEVRGLRVEDVRFVILVDDLDRCLPDTTIALLESIKNYLSVERAIFVLGLNPGVVYQGIRHKYDGLEINGREYLEKILNYTFYVPEPEPMRVVREFARSRFEELVPSPRVRESFAPLFDRFGQALEDCRFTNPRKIKRILNRVLLFIVRHETQMDDYPMHNVARLLMLAEYYPEVFMALREYLWQKDDRTGFSLVQFEERLGYALTDRHPRLAIMRALFDLREQNDINKPKLKHQADAVFGITRLL